MLRVLAAGMFGGVVLVVWSTVFSLLVPARDSDADFSHASSVAMAMTEAFEDLAGRLPVGPAEARAATHREAGASAPAQGFEFSGVARGLGVACASGVFAAVLMSLYGGRRRSFAERVLFAVLLGSFAGCAMMVPAGGWTDFSLARSAPLLGEVLIGWMLAGMVIAVMLSPGPRRVKAS